eukprot:CAMPEP_0182443468 /NCGR_PEP_ID=MMETSP1172-20130603/2195_1 /TAXON_ID=708627 /ORGANISM="Timspurckia oligopyrenoides, Strain CCMP3278" /LENGTH=372 /DNA_ID=CAMNT_0024638761 /DNA_START=759 /DNA_END=1874 /DNA_ORIENTATION=+
MVYLVHSKVPEIGSILSMKLVQREKKSLLNISCARESDVKNLRDTKIGLPSIAQLPFARFVCRNEYQEVDLLQSTIDELLDLRNDSESIADVIELAKIELKNARNQLTLLRNRMKSNGTNVATMEPEKQSDDASNLNDEKVWWFQSFESNNSYLHPWTARLLSYQNGGELSNCEGLLSGSVVNVEKYVMNDSVRSRYRFLSHLPTGYEFQLVELDPIGVHAFTQQTKAHFATKLSQREAKQAHKERARQKREQHYHNLTEARLLEQELRDRSLVWPSESSISSTSEFLSEFSVNESDFPSVQSTTTTPFSENLLSSSMEEREPVPEFSSYASIVGTMGGYFPALSSNTSSSDTIQQQQSNSGQRPNEAQNAW